jgi:hypothetical protein
MAGPLSGQGLSKRGSGSRAGEASPDSDLENEVTEEDDTPGNSGSGFLARGHHKLRFTEIGETFIARLILARCPDPEATAAITVRLSLGDFFRCFTADELTALLKDRTVSEAPKILEIGADVLSMLFGSELSAKTAGRPALHYYHNHIATRLGWLASGDPSDNRWRPPYRFCSLVQQAFGAICAITPPVPPATKPATLTFRVGCESEHGIVGVRAPFMLRVAVVTIQLPDFRDLRQLRSPQFRDSEADVAISLNQRVASMFAALPQRKRYF